MLGGDDHDNESDAKTIALTMMMMMENMIINYLLFKQTIKSLKTIPCLFSVFINFNFDVVDPIWRKVSCLMRMRNGCSTQVMLKRFNSLTIFIDCLAQTSKGVQWNLHE